MRLSITLILLIGYLAASGQTANQDMTWYMYFGNHKLTNKVSLHTEYQFRRTGFGQDWQQSLARVGVDYHINSATSITGGYGYIVSYPYGEQPIPRVVKEHRIWQQLITNNSVGRVGLNHRYRLEQRIIDKVVNNDQGVAEIDGTIFRQRARYRLYASIPVNNPTMEDNTFFIAFYDEVFIGFGDGIGSNILDQNRLYGGVGWRFDKNTNLQIGYLYHRIFKSSNNLREYNNTLNVGFTKNFDLRKKED